MWDLVTVMAALQDARLCTEDLLKCGLGEPQHHVLPLTCTAAPRRLQVTVEEVASLKRVGKGSTLLLLDGSGGQSKAVAKALARKGFRRAFVVSGGFKGAPGRRLPAAAGSEKKIEGPSYARPAPATYRIGWRPSLCQRLWSDDCGLRSKHLDTVHCRLDEQQAARQAQ